MTFQNCLAPDGPTDCDKVECDDGESNKGAEVSIPMAGLIGLGAIVLIILFVVAAYCYRNRNKQAPGGTHGEEVLM